MAEPPYDPSWTLLTDDDLDAMAERLTVGRPRPVPVFAYGSLIWNPGFEVGGIRRATAPGWHRSFCIELNQWRGSPDCPGLMLALEAGGSCAGLVMEVAPGTGRDSMRAILKRELIAHEMAANACWITVETERGVEEALTFYAGTVGQTLVLLPVEGQAQRLAHACGHAGSGAEYLQRTAAALAAHGLDDPLHVAASTAGRGGDRQSAHLRRTDPRRLTRLPGRLRRAKLRHGGTPRLPSRGGVARPEAFARREALRAAAGCISGQCDNRRLDGRKSAVAPSRDPR